MLPENQADVLARLRGTLEQVCEYEGMELVHLELRREGRGRTLRLYIDKPGGVGLNDCVYMSRQVGDLLDVELGDMDGPYNLEVSSPGFDRPLAKAADFDRFRGNEAKIRTDKRIDGQRNFKGILSGMSGDVLELATDRGTIAIPLGEISSARLINYTGERHGGE